MGDRGQGRAGRDYITLTFTAVWNTQQRRQFFETYAKANGFDPLVATNWYLQSKEDIMNRKVCLSISLFFGSVRSLKTIFDHL